MLPPPRPPPSGVPVTERVRREWARRVAAEYGSAAITAQVLTWSIQVGLPPALLHGAARIVTDELTHAELCQACLVALGGADTPIDIQAESLVLPASGGVFPALLEAVVRNFCLGETFAVPYFVAMRARSTHPATRPVLDRVLTDEAVHRAFGWEALDALLQLDRGVATEVARLLPRLIDSFEGYRHPPPAALLTAEEQACGLLDHAEYGALFEETLQGDILPRFAKRGITP